MKLLIAAGGTGGHIFPGIAVAEAFQGLDDGNEVLFVGTEHGMEKRIMPAMGFRLLMIAGRPFLGTSLANKAGTILKVLKGVDAAMTIIRNEKPDAVSRARLCRGHDPVGGVQPLSPRAYRA